MTDVAYDAASTTDLTSQVETIRAANHDIFYASSSTSDAILPMQAGPEPARLPPPMILARGASFSDPIFLPLVSRRQKEG